MSNLNEIKQVVILAAGRSRRMEQLSRKEPKCLLPYRGERVIERLVRQIESNGIEKIFITTGYCADKIKNLFKDNPIVTTVENKLYEEDVNILSMSLALSHVDGPVVIFEADTIMEDALVKYVLGSDFEGKSVWFVKGRFTESQYGGILKSDKCGNVTDIRIVPAYMDKYKSYMKLTGLMRISGSEIELFRALVNKYSRTSLKQYFLSAWIENLKLLPCIEADTTPYEFYTFNRPEEYYQVQKKEIGLLGLTPEISMVEVDSLRGIEEFDRDRVNNLQLEIIRQGCWTVPIIVEKEHGLVLDGQHRTEVARRMGLKSIPAILVEYRDVKVWSLRKEIKVTQSIVIRKVCRKAEMFPYKTVKHLFPFPIPTNLKFKLDDLRDAK